MGAFIDLAGEQFGRLLVLCRSENKKLNTVFTCRCCCGTVVDVLAKNLRNGRTKSCGCVNGAEAHGKASTPTYLTWVGMKQRCLNPHATGYERYGGRGITVDPRWLKFSAFLEDMGERPDGHTLDRIDNDKGYTLDNCVWATYKAQANNRRKRASKPNQPEI